MNEQEFAAPSLGWAVLPVIGGIATGIGLILGLEWLGDRLTPEDYATSRQTVIEVLSTSQVPREME